MSQKVYDYLQEEVGLIDNWYGVSFGMLKILWI